MLTANSLCAFLASALQMAKAAIDATKRAEPGEIEFYC
jgi:hypothetical protein